jgi:hypothetical protein
MRPGRNDPCPCGSGKKYKRCCYLKEQNTVFGNSAESQDLQDEDDSDDSFDEQEFLLKGLTGFRRFFLDKKPHIKEYYKMRKMHSEIMDSMIRYFEDGKFEQKVNTDSVLQSAQGPIIHIYGSEFDLNTDLGTHGFYDIMIYKSTLNMNCITEDFIQNHRYRKAEKVKFLHSMLDSKLGLFEIISTDSVEGYVNLKEVFTGAEYRITDVALSGNVNYGDVYIYTRIIDYNGTSFGTGLNFIFTKTDRFIKDHIKQHKKDYSPLQELVRFTQLYNRYSKDTGKVKAFTNTLA